MTEGSRVDAGKVSSESENDYSQRFVINMSSKALENFDPAYRPFWMDLVSWFESEWFIPIALEPFRFYVDHRFKDTEGGRRKFATDIQLVRDFTHYGLGPHTDHPGKVVVMLLYLSENADNPQLGTSIYVPKDPAFRCEGGTHYPYSGFERVVTMDYMPNSMLGFFKTSNSFHGVEPLKDENLSRNLIQLSIVDKEVR